MSTPDDVSYFVLYRRSAFLNVQFHGSANLGKDYRSVGKNIPLLRRVRPPPGALQ